MLNPKNNLVLAACGGSLAVILTYAVTYMAAGEGDFWLALILGVVVLVTLYLALFFHGLRFAAALDGYEKDAPEYTHKSPAMVRGWDGLGATAMVYLAPTGLTLVWRKRGRLQTLRVEREEVREVLPGKEDLELFLTGGRILSLNWGAEEEASRVVTELFSARKNPETE